MPYLDRLRDCAYTDPNGTTHAILFDDVTRTGEKKTGVFELPQQDRTEVQDLGMVGTRLAMTLYITGEDYDTAADAFFAGLSLRHTDAKPGVLAHPRWGDITVKPLTFSQSESFVDGMGRAVFQVELVTVDVTAKFPTTTVNIGASIETASEVTASTAIAAYIGPTTARDIAVVTQQVTNTLNSLRNQLASVVAVSDDLAAALDSGVTQAIDSIGTLVEAPATMADTLVGLMRLPVTASGSISQKIGAYSTLFDSLATQFTSGASTDLPTLSLALSASALAAAEASIVGDLYNRPDAVAASDSIAALLAYYQSMMDLTGPDGEMVAQVVDLLAMAQAYLLETSFGLKSARRKILDYETDPISEAFLLYGTVEAVPQFMADNQLADGEFYVLSAGREVIWYA